MVKDVFDKKTIDAIDAIAASDEGAARFLAISERKGGRRVPLRLCGERVQLHFDADKEPSKAKQEFREQCDVNNIVRRYTRTGVFEHVNGKRPIYGDYTNVVDYQSALNVVGAAMDAFDALPSAVRSRFNNNPGLFEAFCSDSANRDELIKLGLIELPSKERGVRPDNSVSQDKPEVVVKSEA